MSQSTSKVAIDSDSYNDYDKAVAFLRLNTPKRWKLFQTEIKTWVKYNIPMSQSTLKVATDSDLW